MGPGMAWWLGTGIALPATHPGTPYPTTPGTPLPHPTVSTGTADTAARAAATEQYGCGAHIRSSTLFMYPDLRVLKYDRGI